MRVVADIGRPHPLELKVGVADPLWAARFQQPAQRVQLSAGVQAVDAALPFDLLCSSDDPQAERGSCGARERQGRLSLHLAGLQGQLALDAAAEQLQLTGLSLGAQSSTVALDGDRLARLDLNPDHGRAFDATLRELPQALELTVSPAIDLKLALALTHLSDSMKVDLPDWLMDELFEVMLGGPPRATLRIPRATPCAPAAEPAQRVEISAGRLQLAASSLSQELVVDAGQCIVPVD